MRDKVFDYIRERGLLRAGHRVAAAVSGGADSVALLRVLLELRAELGIVLSVAHFNHGLRGEQSAADEAFVAEVAKEQGGEFICGREDVRAYAAAGKLSLEAAGRRLRYRWFAQLAREQRLDAIATAHTLDDQAETVLLKFLRGAGTRGLAGIYPVVTGTAALAAAEQEIPPFDRDDNHGEAGEGFPPQPKLQGQPSSGVRIVRPMLAVSREEVERYLTCVGQAWREDESNRDRRFLRNRVRHELLPLLQREFNPNIRQALSDLAEIARAEEEYWQGAVAREPQGERAPERLKLNGFSELSVAMQRRLLKSFGERQKLKLDFEHIERLRRCALGEVTKTELPGGSWVVNRGGALEVQAPAAERAVAYRYVLPVPGEVEIREISATLRAHLLTPEFANEAGPGELLSADLVGAEVVIRNWMHGDRFCPAHSRSPQKLKRLFLEKGIPAEQRSSWPVALCGEEIVWVRGLPVGNAYRWRGEGQAVRIEVMSR